jgi:hypothetical protein
MLRSMAWMMGLVLIGCGGDEMRDDAASVGSTEAADGGDTSAESSATTQGNTMQETTAGSNDASGGEETGDATTSSGDVTTDASEDTVGADCGDVSCGANEICVNPCCGGAGPVCYAPDAEGACQGADVFVARSRCLFGSCGAKACCLPSGGCEAPPPFCADADKLQCDDQTKNCNIGQCYGSLEGSQLACQCG